MSTPGRGEKKTRRKKQEKKRETRETRIKMLAWLVTSMQLICLNSLRRPIQEGFHFIMVRRGWHGNVIPCLGCLWSFIVS